MGHIVFHPLQLNTYSMWCVRCVASGAGIACNRVLTIFLMLVADDVSSIEPDDDNDDNGKANLEPIRSRPSTRARSVDTASKKTTKKKTVVKSRNEVSMPVRPRTRRQISESSTVSSQLPSNATDDEADSANTEGASSQSVVVLEGSDSDPEFQRLRKKNVKVAPPVAKRPTTRGRTAWK